MNIRSITYFDNPNYPIAAQTLKNAGNFLQDAQPAFEKAGYGVQTARFATPPFPQLLPNCKSETVISFAQALEAASAPLGFAYTSIGPALPEFPQSYAAIPKVIAQTENVFASGVMADAEMGISLPSVRACAQVIHALAPLDPNGFANLYFAALGNVPPGAPFFPAAYHAKGKPTFALAIEGADLAVEAFTQANSLASARQNLINSLESHAKILGDIARKLAGDWGVSFGGIDYSLAPFPDEALSLGTALERLGVPLVGRHSSLAGAAFLANTIDRAQFPRTGFSGLMLPVLEDATLAARADEGILSIKDLLLYSAVCGTGLDTVPLPGDTTPEQLTAVLLDLAALSVRLDKPLTARLMPIPGKKAGERTNFDFPFFANSRVLAVEAEPLQRLFAGGETFMLQPRNR